MPALRTDLSIEQGTTWARGWAVTYNGAPINNTWTARSQVRTAASSTAKILHEFNAGVDANGNVIIGVSPEESAAWDWTSGVFDVKVVNASKTVELRVVRGKVRVSPGVTS